MSVCGVVPVAVIAPVVPAGTYRRHRVTITLHLKLEKRSLKPQELRLKKVIDSVLSTAIFPR